MMIEVGDIVYSREAGQAWGPFKVVHVAGSIATVEMPDGGLDDTDVADCVKVEI